VTYFLGRNYNLGLKMNLKMKIWLVTIGEPIPSDGENVRLLRTGIFAEFLANNGHQVVWWNNKFNHSKKVMRKLDNVTEHKENLKIHLLDSSGYKKNISAKRFYDHIQLNKHFQKWILNEAKPDIIVASFPTIDLCISAIEYGKQNNIPVVIDIRDLWPDTFLDVLPKFKPLKQLGKFGLSYLYNKASWACKNSTGIVAITPPFLNWGLENAKRKQSENDKVFYFGYNQQTIAKSTDTNSRFKFLNKSSNTPTISFCYIGNISNMIDFQTIKQAMDILHKEAQDIKFQFIVVGSGVALNDFKEMAKNNTDIHFTGYLNAIEIAHVMSHCQLGIVPYIDIPNFQMTISNKVIEYFSGQLAILASVTGFLGTFLKDNQCGLTYENGKPETLAKLLLNLAHNFDELSTMREKSLTLYQNNFQASVVYKNYMNHLEKVVTNYKISVNES
jgi:glycosyltransferase involved in cell wall biosynthesis